MVENVYSFLNKQKIIDKADVDINGFTYLKKNFVITKDDMNEFLEKTYLSELRVDQDVLASLYLSNEEIYKLDILLGSSLMDSDSLILSVSYSELNEASEITINHKF